MIPMMRPRLTRTDKVLPYLERIDESRWYSNFGPLVVEYEQRLSDLFRCHALSTANGTSGLMAALLALDLPKGSLVALPSWTFVASAAAVLASGHVPYFLDVDEKHWSLTPDSVKRMAVAPKAVMPVSVVGAPVDTAAWDRFTDQTGIPVVIDAAGAFDACSALELSRPRKSAVIISTHTTKVLGTGEGGIALTTQKDYLERIRRITNCGFSPDRGVNCVGFNGKISEYGAAIGLAALDEWPEERKKWVALKARYLEAFAPFIGSSPVHSMDWVGSLFNIRLRSHVHPVMNALRDRGIASRQVWGEGCHRYKAYQHFPHGGLTVTEALGDQVLFLPYTIDISDADLRHIATSVKECVA
jgi:dTDP-4-amino-4,6-dideoxygalactose transaminase